MSGTGDPQIQGGISGTFSGTGQSKPFAPKGRFNASISGAGTVQLERSFDNGTTWIGVNKPESSGTLASYAVTASAPLNTVFEEIEANVLWRFNCTAFTSTVTYRASA